MRLRIFCVSMILVTIFSCKEKTYHSNVIQTDLQRVSTEPFIIDSVPGEEIKDEKVIIASKISRNNTKKESVDNIIDTTKYFVVDDFPVKDKMLGKEKNNIDLKSGKLRSVDKVWFINKADDQVLVFELYTDKYHVETFLFPASNIHPSLLKRLSIHTDSGSLATLEEKIDGIKGLVDSSKQIGDKYFITNKSIRLGDTKEKVLQAYGKPTKIAIEDDVEVLQWKFTGELAYDGVTDLKGIPLARQSFGHEATALIKEDRLIALIFYNDIP